MPDADGGSGRGDEPRAPGQLPERSPELFAALYDELERVAERQLRRGGPRVSLSTTTLLHEAYLDISRRPGLRFPDLARFLGYAARAMRGIVIDYSRRKAARKRGGGAFEITLEQETAPAADTQSAELARLSDALDELAAREPALAELVDLHFFCGYTFTEIAGFRGVSERTVQREWRRARESLRDAMLEGEAGG